jgi:hypothetical protein
MLTTTKTLRVFANPHEAEIMRTRLDAAGILAVINGAEVAHMLSHIGTAVAKVRLEVAPEDFDRAIEVLKEDERRRGELTDWKCVRCDEDNDAAFDLCWNCSKKRDPSDPFSQGSRDSDKSMDEPKWSSITVDPAKARMQPPSTNPYAPISDNLQRPGSHPRSKTSDDTNEVLSDQVKRVLYGSIFGVLVLPPLLSLYVLYLLAFRVSVEAYAHSDLRWKLIASWILSAVSVIIWPLVLLSEFGFLR